MSDSIPKKSTPLPSVGSVRGSHHNNSPSNTDNTPISNAPQEIPPESNEDQSPIDLTEEVRDNGKRKLTYSVWDHFKRQKINDQWKAICNYCKKQLGAESKNGTNHLRNHLNRCLFRDHGNGRQTLLNFKKEGGSKVTMGSYSFDQEKSRNDLGKMIVLHEYPLSMVEHIGFRMFVSGIQPLFKVPSRNTVKSDILKIYDYERAKMMILLEKNDSRISITTDMWTSSNQKKGFMAVTAHFIDDSWKLQSRIMRFIYVPCPHTADVLSETLMCCLLDWNIDRKLSTLNVDNCTTNDAMINIVLSQLSSRDLLLSGDFFHMRCCAHILNLIVKDGLDVISSSIENVRDSVAYWTATPKRCEKFDQFARQLKVECEKKLVLDCKTRLNSTYLMLHTALRYKNVFPRLKQRESQYRSLPCDKDWELAKEICERLEVFFEATELFSGTKYPTANLFFPNVCEIKLSLYEWLKSPYMEINLMATSMIEKFNKYWSEIHGILALATILDPRYKMKLIEYYYPLIFENEASHEIEKICQFCRKLVQQYQVENDLSGGLPQTSSSVLSESGTTVGKRMVGFYQFLSSTVSSGDAKTELDIFLEEPVLPPSDDFDILVWWKLNIAKYPILGRIARDILAIPVSTVASESAFSTSGRFVSPHRNRLHPKTLEALMCAQDWLWSEIHENSTTMSYSGCCTKSSDEDIDDEEPSCSLTSETIDVQDS